MTREEAIGHWMPIVSAVFTAEHNIVNLIVSVAYGTMAFLASYAFVRLRRIERKFDSLHGTQRMTFAMMMDGNIRQNQEAVKRLAEEMQQAVDEDRYEDAEQLRKVIAERQQYILKQLAFIKSEFSDECEVRMYRTRAEKSKE